MSNNQSTASSNLPKLRGSRGQLSWAYKIRDYYIANTDNPDQALLKEQTQAKYWIENRVALIGDVELPHSLPQLKGQSEKQTKYAFVIRAKYAEVFPECTLLRSQTDAKFWINYKRISEFAVYGYKMAANEKEESIDSQEGAS